MKRCASHGARDHVRPTAPAFDPLDRPGDVEQRLRRAPPSGSSTSRQGAISSRLRHDWRIEILGRVAELWRYPVKSLVGERLRAAELDARGLAHDRLWSVRDPDGKFGSGKTTRRFRRMDGLLELAATYDGGGPGIAFPDGRRLRGDDPAVDAALSEHVGRPVRLGREEDVSHFDEGPVHLLTTASLREAVRAHGRPVDRRRLRPNVLVETGDRAGLLEDDWIGLRVAVGEQVVLEIRAPMTRCVMVDLAQIDLGREPGLLRAITELNEARLGVVADVVRAGKIREGDPVRLH